MANEELQYGEVTTLVKDTIYALPPRIVRLFCQTATPTIKIGNEVAMTTTVTVTLDANGQAELAAAFIQSTGVANIVVCIKAV